MHWATTNAQSSASFFARFQVEVESTQPPGSRELDERGRDARGSWVILELPPELELFESGSPELLPLTLGYELSIKCRKTDVRQRVVEAALQLAEQPKLDPAEALIEAATTAVPKRAPVADNTPHMSARTRSAG